MRDKTKKLDFKAVDPKTKALGLVLAVGTTKAASYAYTGLSGAEQNSEWREIGATFGVTGNMIMLSVVSIALYKSLFGKPEQQTQNDTTPGDYSNTQLAFLVADVISKKFTPEVLRNGAENLARDPIKIGSIFTFITGVCLMISGHQSGRDVETLRGLGQATAHAAILLSMNNFADNQERPNMVPEVKYFGSTEWQNMRSSIYDTIHQNPRRTAAWALAGLASIDGLMAQIIENDGNALMAATLLVLSNIILSKSKTLAPQQAGPQLTNLESATAASTSLNKY